MEGVLRFVYGGRVASGATTWLMAWEREGRVRQEKHEEKSLAEPGRWTQSLRRAFFVVFAVLFGWLLLNVLFGNVHYSYLNPAWVLLCAGVWAALLVGLWWLCGRGEGFLAKREIWCIVAFFVLLAITQLIFYSQTAAYPTRDFERVFTAAVNFTVNGFIEEPYLDYFYKYPNNMPAVILLQFVFRAFHRLGIDYFYVIGAMVGAACIQFTYLFVYLCCRRLLGVRQGFFSLGLLYLCVPLQCYVSIFYTDVLTLPFAPFLLYMYLRLRDAKTWKGWLLAAGLLGLGAAVGVKLKYSVAIVLIAIGVDLLLRADWKRLLFAAVAACGLFFAVNALFNSYMYAHFLDESLAADRATPFSAWVMMGLKGDGGHDPADNDLVWVLPTKAEKEAAAMAEIRERLSGFTPVGFAQFLNQKALHSFGSGNLDYPNTVADSPMHQTFLVECVSENGLYFLPFDTFIQGYHVLLFALLTAGAALAAKRKDYTVFVPYVAIFGLYLFLLLWESGQRYLLNYYGMFVVAAVWAMGVMPVWGFRRKKSAEAQRLGQHEIQVQATELPESEPPPKE